MIKYNDLKEDQKRLVDTHIALNIGRLIGTSAEIPAFIANETYIEKTRNELSKRIKELEKTRDSIFPTAKERGIDLNNPQAYIDRAIAIVEKLCVLNHKQVAYCSAKPQSASENQENSATHTVPNHH